MQVRAAHMAPGTQACCSAAATRADYVLQKQVLRTEAGVLVPLDTCVLARPELVDVILRTVSE